MGGFNFDEEKLDSSEAEREWLLLLAYIGAKRTHLTEFRTLFDRLLTDEDHPHHKQAKTLETLYDFTPLRKVEE